MTVTAERRKIGRPNTIQTSISSSSSSSISDMLKFITNNFCAQLESYSVERCH